jgi:TniQ
MQPLLVAPRPIMGEAMSSWVRRLAGRYEISSPVFVDALCDGTDQRCWGCLDDILDTNAWPELDKDLAEAARLDTAEIAALRPIACQQNAEWLRSYPAWCERCVGEDMVRHGEMYFRSAWRVASCTVCACHGSLLESADRWWTQGGPFTDSMVELRCSEGRQRLLGYRIGLRNDRRPPASVPPGWDVLGGIMLAPGNLARVLELQATLGDVLAYRHSTDRWDYAITKTALPAVCALLMNALATREASPSTRPIRLLFALFASCASILEVLSGRPPVHTLVPGCPMDWVGCETPDLGELMAFLAPAAGERLAAGATEIGGTFATATALALEWAGIVRAAGLEDVEEQEWQLTLDPSAYKTLATTKQACVEAGAIYNYSL